MIIQNDGKKEDSEEINDYARGENFSILMDGRIKGANWKFCDNKDFSYLFRENKQIISSMVGKKFFLGRK
jgi:hypothetical protein